MQAYRLIKKKYITNPFDPEGARLFGGRWNSRGVSMVYAADSISLAMLEILVHTDHSAGLPNYAIAIIDVPDDMVIALDDSALPQDWNSDPPSTSTAIIGDQWIESNESLVMTIPSVVVPEQSNYLINPSHEDFETVLQSLQVRAYPFNARLQK